MNYYQTYSFDVIGTITVVATKDYVTHLSFGEISSCSFHSSMTPKQKETALHKQVKQQLLEYVNKKRTAFTIPFKAKGTEFQETVWKQLCQIPYGSTKTYKEIAIAAIGKEQSARAVGMANNKNPISILIPCHRVIGSNGTLVGYGGGLDKKIQLLNLEGNNYVYR